MDLGARFDLGREALASETDLFVDEAADDKIPEVACNSIETHVLEDGSCHLSLRQSRLSPTSS